MAAVWPGEAKSDDSLFKAMSELRAEFASHASGLSIRTERTVGYRLEVDASHVETAPPFDVRAALEPFLTIAAGRASLESLNQSRIAGAAAAFADLLRQHPHHPAARIGRAYGLFLQFESTRAHGLPDWRLLDEARRHALDGCASDPASPAAWGALALIQNRLGEPLDAEAAALKAVTLGPGDWHNRLRLAFVCGGTRRLVPALDVLRTVPENPLGHWLAATVYVAREAFDVALDHLMAGCRQVDLEQAAGGDVSAVGLHLLHGLVRKRLGQRDAAAAALERELTFETCGHLYAAEACANTSYTQAAMALEDGDATQAHACFQEALSRIPGHGPTIAALRALVGREGRKGLEGRERRERREGITRHDPLQAAIESAITLALTHGPVDAADVVRAALASYPAEGPGSAWILPVEPILNRGGNRSGDRRGDRSVSAGAHAVTPGVTNGDADHAAWHAVAALLHARAAR